MFQYVILHNMYHIISQIFCLGKEDPQERLDAIRETIRELHPAICTVMRYLFKFLDKSVLYTLIQYHIFSYSVSQYTSETKMNSANLALVFGPTLTRAPADADPRLLHNDVPAINVLIQLCIEHHIYIFGEESEEDGLSSPPPPPEEPPVSMLGTSPDGIPPYLPDEESESPEIIETVLDDVIEMPIPADTVEEAPEPDVVVESIVEPPEETHPLTEEQPVHESAPLVIVESPVAELPTEEHPIEKPPAEELHPTEPSKKESPIEVQVIKEQPQGEEPTVEEPTPDDKLVQDAQTFHSQVSTSSISGYLEEALHDIETSIESMKDRPKSSTPVAIKEESDSGDSDSDTEGT